MGNIPIYFCNIHMKHLQHTFETSETLEIYACNMRFQRNNSLLLGRMKDHWRVEFTDVELVAWEEKAAVGPMEKAAVGLCGWSMSCARGKVRCELCVGEFSTGRHELEAGEFRPSHHELGRRSARCAQAGSVRSAAGELHPSYGELGSLRSGQMSAGSRGEHRMSAGGLCTGQPPWAAQPSSVAVIFFYFKNKLC
jgi:hypothetical protein